MIILFILMTLLPTRWFEIPDKVLSHPVIAPMKQDLIALNYDIYTIVAGRRSFKTETGKRFMVSQATGNDNKTYHIGAPTRMQAKEIFWNDIKALIPPFLIKDKSETELKIKLKNGSVLNIVGLTEFKRVEGGRSHGALFSEFQECDIEVYTQSFEPMLNDTGGFAIFEGRPHGKNHLFDFYQKGIRGEVGCKSYHWTAETVLSPEQIERAKSRLAELDYRREYLADFETGGISPYYAYSNANHKKLVDYDKSEFNVMCDFNATDKPMSWNLGKTIGNEDYILKTFSYQFTNTLKMCEILDEWLVGVGFYDTVTPTLYFYGDYSGKNPSSNSSYSDWEIIENYFSNKCKVVKRIKPCRLIRDTVAATNARLCNTNGERRLFVDKDECKPLMEDWDKCKWKGNGRELDEKDPLRGHACRALDYMMDYNYPIKGKPTVIQGRQE